MHNTQEEKKSESEFIACNFFPSPKNVNFKACSKIPEFLEILSPFSEYWEEYVNLLLLQEKKLHVYTIL